MKFAVSLLAYIAFIASPVAADPVCLSICLANATSPCSVESLPVLISCLYAECSSNSALGRISASYAPHQDASCKHSPDLENALTISGLGRCATSPSGFQSFTFGTQSSLSQICSMELYPSPDCVGDVTTLRLEDMSNGCVAKSGRSARLSCNSGIDPSAIQPYLQTVCGGVVTPNATSSASMTSSATPTSVSASSSSEASVSAINGSSNATGSLTPSSPTTMPPFYGGAGERELQDASIAALVALIAAFVML